MKLTNRRRLVSRLNSLRAFRARTPAPPSSPNAAPATVAGAVTGPRIVGICAAHGCSVMFDTKTLRTTCACGYSNSDLKDARR